MVARSSDRQRSERRNRPGQEEQYHKQILAMRQGHPPIGAKEPNFLRVDKESIQTRRLAVGGPHAELATRR